MPSSEPINYPASEIQTLSGLQAIRKRPTMYVGPLDDPELASRLAVDACCMALEQASKGLVTKISVTVKGPHQFIIQDNGPGWSVEMKENKHWPIWIMTAIFACRDLKEEDKKDFCKHSLAVVNALSYESDVLIAKEKSSHSFFFEDGEPLYADQEWVYNGKKNPSDIKPGTRLFFGLDDSIVESTLQPDLIQKMLDKYSCGLNVEVSVIDQRWSSEL